MNKQRITPPNVFLTSSLLQKTDAKKTKKYKGERFRDQLTAYKGYFNISKLFGRFSPYPSSVLLVK